MAGFIAYKLPAALPYCPLQYIIYALSELINNFNCVLIDNPSFLYVYLTIIPINTSVIVQLHWTKRLLYRHNTRII
jgi:hypothetical protein